MKNTWNRRELSQPGMQHLLPASKLEQPKMNGLLRAIELHRWKMDDHESGGAKTTENTCFTANK